MDYDYIEDDRPRFQLASGPVAEAEEKKVDLKQVAVCSALAIVLLGYGWMVGRSFTQFFAVWVAVAFLVGPFAPVSYTGGDWRVGVGELLPDEQIEPDLGEPEKRQGGRRRQDSALNRVQSRESLQSAVVEKTKGTAVDEGLGKDLHESEPSEPETVDPSGEAEWTTADFGLLRKQMVKHPRGTGKRWEVISEVFQGAHSVDSVIKMAKALGERKPADDDSYARFLAQRKAGHVDISSPLSKREAQGGLGIKSLSNGTSSSVGENGEEGAHAGQKKSLLWSEADDKSLLKALKEFPKDTPMRWDKVAAALPGKSKVQCFRRFSDLRDTYRSKKGADSLAELE